MTLPLLATKLHIPAHRPQGIPRPRLIARLNAGLDRSLTLISAPPGFGKTSLLGEWIAASGRPAAWVSLDAGESDPARFLAYLVAAIQTVAGDAGRTALGMLEQAPPPPVASILTVLVNELTSLPEPILLILDDYHFIDATPVDEAAGFLLDHLPPQVHLVIASREDPPLPLARLRSRGDITELRAADLRFSAGETASFLNEVMGLDLPGAAITALERRTEGWIAGLQLAALSMQGRADTTGFIESFTGSHRYIVDYLVEEVLARQPDRVQRFLLRTSILDQLCGPLCDAVMEDAQGSGQRTLEAIERSNLFLIPLDSERTWYRYHHLFAEVLRQRLLQATTATGDGEEVVAGLHRRASQWYEDDGQELAALRHAGAAGDVARVERLIEGGGMPLQFRGAGAPVLAWLESQPRAILDARPSLWVTYASALLFGGQHYAAESKLQAAEAILEGAEPDDRTRDLIGRIASMRATLGIIQDDAGTIITQSRRALAHLDPGNLLVRTATTYTLGYAYQLQGARAAASEAFAGVIASAASLGTSIYTIAATISLAQIQEADTRLRLATETYRRVLDLAGDPPQPIATEAYLGLGRIAYERNDLEAAREHGQRCFALTQQMESVATFPSYAVLLAQIRLAGGDLAGAASILAEADTYARQHHFDAHLPRVAAAQVRTLLRQGSLAAAADLARAHDLPASLARVCLAAGDGPAAIAVLEPWHAEARERDWRDRVLEATTLRALAHQATGETALALHHLEEALVMAEPDGHVRLFVDEGPPMVRLLGEARARGILPASTGRLLAALAADERAQDRPADLAAPLAGALSQRELEVTRLIAQGLSNREIAERLYLALDTVKGHNRRIFNKLGVQRRSEVIARARELGLAEP